MDTTEQTAPAPAKPKARRAAAKRAAVPAPKTSEMAGITAADCPMVCNAKRCVISGVGICAHPGKGGLQAALQNDVSLRKFNEAKRILGKAKLDLMG